MKNIQILFRCTEEQKKAWQQCAEAEEEGDLSRWIRRTLDAKAGRLPTPRPKGDNMGGRLPI